MNTSRVAVRAMGAGVLVAVVVGAMPYASSAGAGLVQAASQSSTHGGDARQHHQPGHTAQALETSDTGNRIELVDPGDSRYVPNVLQAPAEQRDRARSLLRGVNRFCRTHTVAELRAGWRPGEARQTEPTHYFNPERRVSGIDPTRPRAALVYDGEVGGVMFTGRPLPRLGVIPRAHRHGHGSSMGTDSDVEMVHVYCTEDLTVKSVREGFTPNRLLGVLADTVMLRLRIRPAVMELGPRQLREVRSRVRSYIGRQPSDSSGARATAGPDPVLQAMRTEIRQGLMQLDEAQLRSVWRLMKSYRR